jgi:predicted RNA-binding Zn-ribbon protein involved in translation (DUF1610 family)
MSNIQEWHPVILPSLGVYYGGKCPDGRVEITPWTTAQEERLVRYASNPGMDRRQMIEELISGSVKLPEGMAIGDLVIADQHYLLMKLRAISLVALYTVDHRCPKCGTSHEVSYDIDELPIINPKPNDKDEFVVTLPRSKSQVTMRLLRVKDEQKIAEYRKRKADLAMGSTESDVYLYSLARQVSQVNGESLKFDEKKDFLRDLVMIDLAVIKQAIEDRELGIDTAVKARCPNCGAIDEWDLPIQVGFFRPKRADLAAAIGVAE